MVHVPPPPEPADRFAFTPVPTRPRRDGWTPAVQRAFIAALVGGESVDAAARRVGRSRKSAYALRARPDAAAFAAAWDAAMTEAIATATSLAIDRCAEATRQPVIFRGRVIGERIVHDDRMLMRILGRRLPSAEPDLLTTFERAQRGLYNFNEMSDDERL